MRRLMLAVAIAAIGGFLAGIYAPFSARASQTAELRFLPPSDPDGTTTRLTYGWHGGSSLALDWDDVVSTTVYARTRGISSDASPTSLAFAGLTTGTYEGCDYNVFFDVYDPYAGSSWLFSTSYVHTVTPQFTGYRNLYFTSGGYLGSLAISLMATQADPNPGCPSSGTHVHETQHGGGSVPSGQRAKNTAYPTGAIGQCPTVPGDCPTYFNTSSSNWTRRFWWTSNSSSPPPAPTAVDGSFNFFGNPYSVLLCWSPSSGATSYQFLFRAWNGGASYNQIFNVSTVGCGSKIGAGATLSVSDWEHIAVRACNATGCSGWVDMTSPYQYWTYIPCYYTNGANCSGGGTPNGGGHSH